MNSRLAKLLALMLALILVMASAIPAWAESQTTAGQHVECLVIGTTKANEGTNIMSQAGMFGRINYNGVVCANLFYPDENGIAQPYFFETCDVSEDGCQLTVTFPTTAIWHDGLPVTVDDVVFTFEYRRDVMKSSALVNLTDITVNSENSITLTFSEPDLYSFIQNSFLTTYIIPKHIWENVEDYKAYTGEDACIGCGPYKLVSIDQDAGTMLFEAVPENSYLGELTVDSILLKSYSSQDALLMAMANGEIDVMYDYSSPISYTLLDVIKDNPDVDPGASNYKGNYQVTMGMNHEANQTYEFREAAIKCLNWSLLTNIINGEYGQIPGSGIIPPSNVGFDDSLWTFYQDVEEAKTLLDNAGFVDADGDGMRDLTDGTPFRYAIYGQYSGSKQDLINRIGDILVASLRDVGIDAYYDQDSLTNSEASNKARVDCLYDMFIGYTTTGMATYDTAFGYMANKEAKGSLGWSLPEEGWGESYNDPELNAAYEALEYAPNQESYEEAAKTLQRLASEKLFGFALCWEQCFFPYRTDKYQGFVCYPSIGVVHARTFYELTTK